MASSFHLVPFSQNNSFIYLSQRFSLTFLSCAAALFPPPFLSLYFLSLPGPLTLILSRVCCATLALAHLIPETLKRGEEQVSVGFLCSKDTQTETQLKVISENILKTANSQKQKHSNDIKKNNCNKQLNYNSKKCIPR